jgi:hypothetical protein
MMSVALDVGWCVIVALAIRDTDGSGFSLLQMGCMIEIYKKTVKWCL